MTILALLLSRNIEKAWKDIHLIFYKTVFWAGDEDKALDFQEVGQFSRVEFAYADCVAFLLFACEKAADMGYQREIGS